MIAQKEKSAAASDESDTIDAFVALGGAPDKSGEISADKLRQLVREFGLTIDIETLIREVDTDKSGYIDYEEFRRMMT
jgi:calmodulin